MPTEIETICKNLILEYQKREHKKYYRMWEVHNSFNRNWDINADNLGEMLRRSLSGVMSIIHNNWYQPYWGLITLAETEEFKEEIRRYIKDLIYEGENYIFTLQRRIDSFVQKVNLLAIKRLPKAKYFQDIYTTSMLLFMVNPSKNYWFTSGQFFGIKEEKLDEINVSICFEDYYECADYLVDFIKKEKLKDYIEQHTIIKIENDADYHLLACDVLRRVDEGILFQ